MNKAARIGRPPRVTSADIVRAALAVGLAQANIRNVAERLKMSPTGLYRHVRTREELLDLVGEFVFADAFEGLSEGQSFKESLLLVGRRMFDLYASEPETIQMVSSGFVLVTVKITELLERIIAKGVSEGFSVAEAFDIWTRVMAAVLGAATVTAWGRATRRADASFISLFGAADDGSGGAGPKLSELASVMSGKQKLDNFASVHIMLEGLNVRYGGRLR
jgi:AcrR family transcriptional regulator